jgi:hypothetical protein
VVTFFRRFFLEICCDTWKSDVITGEVGIKRVVDVADVVFNVDLFIDCGFAFGMEINSCVGSADGSFIYYCKFALYSVEWLEDDAGEFGGGGAGNDRSKLLATTGRGMS